LHRCIRDGSECFLSWRKTPWVIGRSADNSDDAVEQCINVDMRSVLGKPIDRQQLALAVAQALRQKQGL